MTIPYLVGVSILGFRVVMLGAKVVLDGAVVLDAAVVLDTVVVLDATVVFDAAFVPVAVVVLDPEVAVVLDFP